MQVVFFTGSKCQGIMFAPWTLWANARLTTGALYFHRLISHPYPAEPVIPPGSCVYIAFIVLTELNRLTNLIQTYESDNCNSVCLSGKN